MSKYEFEESFKDVLDDMKTSNENMQKSLQDKIKESVDLDEEDDDDIIILTVAWFLALYLAKVHEITAATTDKKSFKNLAIEYRDKFEICFAYPNPPASKEEEKDRNDEREADEADFAHVLNNIDEEKLTSVYQNYTATLINSTQQLDGNEKLLTELVISLFRCFTLVQTLLSEFVLSNEEAIKLSDELQDELNKFNSGDFDKLDSIAKIKQVFKIFFENFAQLHAMYDVMPNKMFIKHSLN